jgi:addiction module RelE/StbE family toxin
VKPIEPHKSFVKSFAKRVITNKKLKDQYELRVDMFIAGQRTAPINDHPLSGDLQGRRAFSITADVRVIYIELEDKIIFLDIGTHNQVY